MADADAPATGVLLVHTADAQAVILRQALSARPGLDVLDEVLTTREAISSAERLQPRVLVMDVGLGDLAGHGVLRSVRRVAPDTRVVLHARTADLEDPAGTRRWVAQLVGVTLDPVRPAVLAARLELPGEPLGVPMARSFVSELLGEWDLDGLVPPPSCWSASWWPTPSSTCPVDAPSSSHVTPTCCASPCPTRVPACPTSGS